MYPIIQMVEKTAAKTETIAKEQVTKWGLVKTTFPLTKSYLQEILCT